MQNEEGETESQTVEAGVVEGLERLAEVQGCPSGTNTVT